MHLLSDNNVWDTISEFVSPDGKISNAHGESKIIIKNDDIENRSWVTFGESKIENYYSVKKENESKYSFISENPHLGTQKGIFSIDRNVIYSKFSIVNTKLNGFEIIIRNNDVCEAFGSLYNGEELMNTWKARMIRKDE